MERGVGRGEEEEGIAVGTEDGKVEGREKGRTEGWFEACG